MSGQANRVSLEWADFMHRDFEKRKTKKEKRNSVVRRGMRGQQRSGMRGPWRRVCGAVVKEWSEAAGP